MYRIRRAFGLVLAMLTVLTLFPMQALAEQAQPYDSVEHSEAGVTIYHNKDGTETLVVEAIATTQEADTTTDRLVNAGGFLTNEGNMVEL